MADEEHVDLPDDFERLLRQELSVDPSPAFAARVRAQVAEDRRPVSWRPWVLAFAAAAAIALAVWLPLRRDRVDPSLPVVATAPPRVTPSTAPPVASVSTGVERRVRPVRSVAKSTTASVAPLASTPEDPVVVIDRAQQAAFTTVMRMLDSGRLTGDSFAQTTPTSMRPIADQVVPIGVAPVAVSPMSVGGVLPYDIERN